MVDFKLISCALLAIVISQCSARPGPMGDQDKDIIEVNVERGLYDKEEGKHIREGDVMGDSFAKSKTVRRRARRSAYGFSWPHNPTDGLIYVPYEYSSSYDGRYIPLVEGVIQQYAEKTCIRLVPRTTEKRYIKIIEGGGCWSYIGRQPDNLQPQEVSLPDGCLSNGTIAHEFMHALGFSHEHSRWDRDQYVRVKWENVQERYKPQFNHPPRGEALVYGETYDYDSVMHYGSYSFSKDYGVLKTMERIDDPNYELGQRDGFSVKDLIQINRRYVCTEHQTPVRPVDKNHELAFKVSHEKEADSVEEYSFGPWGRK